MVNLGTCSAVDFDAQKAAALARFRANYGPDTPCPSEPRAVPGTVLQTLKPVKIMSHNPPSWFTARGAMAKRRQMESRGLPSFKGWLFVTLTLDRDDETGYACAETGYKDGKEKLRKFIYSLRKTYGYEIKRYCWKLEFHKPDADGRIYPHWHLLLDCKQFMKKEEAEKAWGLGHTHSLRVRTDRNLEQKKFGYVFKYAAKCIEHLPEYILDSDKRLRAWQTSPDFYKTSGTRTGSAKKTRASLRPPESAARSGNTQNAASSFFDDETSGEKTEAATCAGSPLSAALQRYRLAKAELDKQKAATPHKRRRGKSTLRERMARWSRSCVIVSENQRGQKRYQMRPLNCDWSAVALEYAAYTLANRADFSGRNFSVSASSIQIPDEQYLLRVPFAFVETDDATPHALAADANPF